MLVLFIVFSLVGGVAAYAYFFTNYLIKKQEMKNAWDFKFLGFSIRDNYFDIIDILSDNDFIITDDESDKDKLKLSGNYCNVPCKIIINLYKGKVHNMYVSINNKYKKEVDQIKIVYHLTYKDLLNFSYSDVNNTEFFHKENPIYVTFTNSGSDTHICFNNSDIDELIKQDEYELLKQTYRI